MESGWRWRGVSRRAEREKGRAGGWREGRREKKGEQFITRGRFEFSFFFLLRRRRDCNVHSRAQRLEPGCLVRSFGLFSLFPLFVRCLVFSSFWLRFSFVSLSLFLLSLLPALLLLFQPPTSNPLHFLNPFSFEGGGGIRSGIDRHRVCVANHDFAAHQTTPPPNKKIQIEREKPASEREYFEKNEPTAKKRSLFLSCLFPPSCRGIDDVNESSVIVGEEGTQGERSNPPPRRSPFLFSWKPK